MFKYRSDKFTAPHLEVLLTWLQITIIFISFHANIVQIERVKASLVIKLMKISSNQMNHEWNA